MERRKQENINHYYCGNFNHYVGHYFRGLWEWVEGVNSKNFLFLKKISMMWTKEKLKATIDSFPEELTVDEVIERLILMEKIEMGNEQSEKGQVISEEELDKEIERWFE